MKIRVGVIFGGRSGEHEVSLQSATSVINYLDKEKFDIVPLGISKEGKWLLPHEAKDALSSGLDVPSTEVILRGGTGDLIPLENGVGVSATKVDVVFPVLHGTYGEDGTIQGLLELAQIPYVGSGVLASAVGMDKAFMKDVFAVKGLPIVPYRVYTFKEWQSDMEGILNELEESLEYPLFVKPANLGSSVGVSKAKDIEGLKKGIHEAFRYDRKIVVEQGLSNIREIECSVLGNDEPIASIPGEIIPNRDFYDYKAKYIDNASELIIPAKLKPETKKRVQDLAVKAFKALDSAGMARVDFFVTQDEEVILNEINSIPGFTKISMYPKLWEASGIDYTELLTRLIELALERHQEKQRIETSFAIPLDE